MKKKKDIRTRTNISTISEQIYQRRWRFIGHTHRMDANQHPKTALTWDPEGKKVATDRERPGAEPQRKKGQPWVLRRGAKR